LNFDLVSTGAHASKELYEGIFKKLCYESIFRRYGGYKTSGISDVGIDPLVFAHHLDLNIQLLRIFDPIYDQSEKSISANVYIGWLDFVTLMNLFI
jgi:hypothetical protein